MPKTESALEEAGPSSKKPRVEAEESDATPPVATRVQPLLFKKEDADVHFVIGHPEKVRMQAALFYEPFLFCSRDDLERLQPATQSLRDMIVKGSKLLLPLRPIWRVEMCREYVALKNNIAIIVKDDDEPAYEASVLDGDFEQTFRRLQNICVQDFVIGIRDNPFLRHWMAAQKAAAFTDFTVLNFHLQPTDAATIEVFDSIVNHLRPKAAGFFIQRGQKKRNEGVLFLMCRDALLNNLETFRLTVEGKSFPLTIFFLDHSYAKYEVWMDGPYAANAIDGFIETFIRDGCANTKLKWVYVGWDAHYTDQYPAPKRLKKSTKVDVPMPKIRHIEPRAPSYRVSSCKSYSFVNTMQWRRMDVYKWTLARSTLSGAVYDKAYIVQFLMKDL